MTAALPGVTAKAAWGEVLLSQLPASRCGDSGVTAVCVCAGLKPNRHKTAQHAPWLSRVTAQQALGLLPVLVALQVALPRP